MKPETEKLDDPRPPLRSMEEIQYAHDVISWVIDDADLRAKIGTFNLPLMQAACDALCWVLNHDSPDFAENLEELVGDLVDAGCSFERLPAAMMLGAARVGILRKKPGEGKPS